MVRLMKVMKIHLRAIHLRGPISLAVLLLSIRNFRLVVFYYIYNAPPDLDGPR